MKKLSRAERVRSASSRFKLAPQAVEEALNWIDRQKVRSESFGNKAERKQIKLLRDAVHKARNYARSDRLPPFLRNAIFINKVEEQLEGLREFCDTLLGHKLQPRRDDADGFEKREAAWAALFLLLNRQPCPQPFSESDHQELAAILYGTTNAATMRTSYKSYVKEMPGATLLPLSGHPGWAQLHRARSRPKVAELEGSCKPKEKKPGVK